jgi:hypothetical protein
VSGVCGIHRYSVEHWGEKWAQKASGAEWGQRLAVGDLSDSKWAGNEEILLLVTFNDAQSVILNFVRLPLGWLE